MKLLTKAIEKSLPAFYATEKIPTQDKVIKVKFFSPYSNWTWYGVEYDPSTRTFFGWIHGHEKEWGYFSLTELESLTGMGGRLPLVERDMHFTPCKVSELK